MTVEGLELLEALQITKLALRNEKLAILGNWRFFVPDKENTKRFTGTKKCGVVRRGNGEAMT
jgi:hypothetical protein